MTAILAEKNLKEDIEMRTMYCQTLMDLAEQDKRIVMLDADLMSSMKTVPFMKKYPERTFNCGVQEANMIGVAAGLSATGKIPFAHTFAPFATRRVFDQVFISGAYAKLNVRIIGSDPGITSAYNGGTHMPFEDMGIMRNIPTMTVIEPSDSTMLREVIKMTTQAYGMFYIRLLRSSAIKIYDERSEFTPNKAVKLREGDDATIFASGIMVAEALKAHDLLKEKGIKARVYDLYTLKPIDQETIISAATETGAIVTAENHNIINGMGSAVAEVLVENRPVPMERIGVQDLFGEVGSVDYLRERFELTANDIVKKVEKVLKRKK